jgi:hypothetical protein
MINGNVKRNKGLRGVKQGVVVVYVGEKIIRVYKYL